MVPRVCPKLLILNILLMSVLLSACTAPSCGLSYPDVVSGELEKLVDKSLLTGEPCASPCWYGITPGITSETEALDIVNGLKFINLETINVNKGVRGGGISWQTVFPETQTTRGGISFPENGTVTGIGMTLSYHMTLQELIDVIGAPDGTMTDVVMIYDSPAPYCMSVKVVWFDEGLEVRVASLPISDKTSSLVEPNFPARYLTYFPSVANLEEYIAVQGGSTSNFAKWEGFDQ